MYSGGMTRGRGRSWWGGGGLQIYAIPAGVAILLAMMVLRALWLGVP